MTDRELAIRIAMTRYRAGERLRLIAYVSDQIGAELSGDEAEEVVLSQATGCLPFGGEAIPEPENVPMCKPHSVPDDLADLLRGHGCERCGE